MRKWLICLSFISILCCTAIFAQSASQSFASFAKSVDMDEIYLYDITDKDVLNIVSFLANHPEIKKLIDWSYCPDGDLFPISVPVFHVIILNHYQLVLFIIYYYFINFFSGEAYRFLFVNRRRPSIYK